jgi:hypothetical protein
VKREETGAEELRRIVNVLDSSSESAHDPFNAEQLIRIVRACWASPWDIYPDQLTGTEREYAAAHGKLSDACNKRLDKLLG